jgi:hypothetical protein
MFRVRSYAPAHHRRVASWPLRRHAHLQRSLSIGAAGILVVALTGCTGRGGGQLPPNAVLKFNAPASFGFSFSCEDKGGTNPSTGQLRIQLSYTDHGTNPIGSSFGIHGIVDMIDPGLESLVCSGQFPPPEPVLAPNELIFLGRHRLVSSAPERFPVTCRARETETTPLCRFEVKVIDNDMDRAPSRGDYFQIRLSSAVSNGPVGPEDSVLPPATVFYTRFGFLSGGNLTVD